MKPDVIDFSKVEFDAPLNLEGFLFPFPAEFSFSKFSAGANFRAVQFFDEANFVNATFSENEVVKFNDVEFWYGGIFNGASLANAEFVNAKFSGSARFAGSKFCGQTVFSNSWFMGLTQFDGAEFSTLHHLV